MCSIEKLHGFCRIFNEKKSLKEVDIFWSLFLFST